MNAGDQRLGGRGFTLLELLIAIAILGLALTAILTSQTGLFSSAKRAGRLSQAVGLARCKMNEVEETLLRKGYQLTRQDEDGPCCEDDESDFQCHWEILPIELPELGDSSFGADAGVGGGITESLDSFSALGEMGDSLSTGDTASAVGDLSGLAGAGGPGAGPSMGASALAPMAMGFIYPQLKEMLEASIRKIVVRVWWKEGPRERDVTVTQYVTNPQQGGLLGEAIDLGEELSGGVDNSGTTSSPSGASTGSSR